MIDDPHSPPGAARSWPLGIALSAALLAGCGGGGGGGNSAPEPVVTSVSAGAVKYSQKLLVTVQGSNVNSGLSVSSPGCKSAALSTTAPNVSDSSTAYYTCTASAIGAFSVTVARNSDGASLGSANFTVAAPKVTLSVSNGGSVTGTMIFTLAPDKTPLTVDNFLRYVNDGFYNNTVFHRLVMSPVPFVIQGGVYRTDAARGIFASIPLEVNKGLSNVKWSIAMARVSGQPDSASSQFFINLADNSTMLDPRAPTSATDDANGYAVFGQVETGTDVVTAMSGAPCAPLSFGTTAITQAPECTPQPYMVVSSAVQTQ